MSNYTTQENSYISSVDAKSLIINQLTREIESLKRNGQETSHLLEKISNLEYMCQLLTTEKERSQQDFDFKNDKNFGEIADLKSELESYARKFHEQEYDVEKYLNLCAQFEQSAENKTKEVFKLEEELRKKSEEIIHFESEMTKLGRLHHEVNDNNLCLKSEMQRHETYIEELRIIIEENEDLLTKNNEEKSSLERDFQELTCDFIRLETENKSLKETTELQKTKHNKMIDDWEQSLYDIERKDVTIRGFEEEMKNLKEKYMVSEQEFGVKYF